MTRFIIILFALMSILGLTACATDAEVQQDISEAAAIVVSAEDLHEGYEGNRIAADARFKDKIVSVTGIVVSVDEDWTGNAYVQLGYHVEIMEYLREYGVQCFFADSNRQMLATLGAGDQVTLKGVVKDYVFEVEVRGCTVESVTVLVSTPVSDGFFSELPTQVPVATAAPISTAVPVARAAPAPTTSIAPPSPGLTNITDAASGFSLDYPEGWEIGAAQAPLLFYVGAPVSGGLNPSLAVAKDGTQGLASIDAIVDANLLTFEDLSTWILISRTNTEFSDHEGILLTGSYDASEINPSLSGDVLISQGYVLGDDVFWVISCTGLVLNASDLIPCEEAIQTFEILQ